MTFKSVYIQNHIPEVAFLVSALLIIQGCVIFLSAVATVIMMNGNNHFATTVLVKKDLEPVYAATIQVLENEPDITITQIQGEAHLIEAMLAGSEATIKVAAYGPKLTQLIITADADGSDSSIKDVALTVVRRICEKMDVSYKLISD